MQPLYRKIHHQTNTLNEVMSIYLSSSFTHKVWYFLHI